MKFRHQHVALKRDLLADFCRSAAKICQQVIVVCVAVTVTACGSRPGPRPTPTTAAAPTSTTTAPVVPTTEDAELAFDSLAQSLSADVALITPATLTVCVNPPFPPFEYSKQSDGEDLSGIDVDIISALAKNNRLDVVFVKVPFETIFDALQQRRCDVIASAVPVTTTRTKNVDFTRTYLTVRQSILVRSADAETYTSLESLTGKTIGVQTGSLAASRFRAHQATGVTVLEFPGRYEMTEALRSSQIDALVADSPINGFEAEQNDSVFAVSTLLSPTSASHPGNTGPHDEQRYGFAVAKNNPALTASLNESLTKLAAKGLLRKTIVRYIGPRSYLP